MWHANGWPPGCNYLSNSINVFLPDPVCIKKPHTPLGETYGAKFSGSAGMRSGEFRLIGGKLAFQSLR